MNDDRHSAALRKDGLSVGYYAQRAANCPASVASLAFSLCFAAPRIRAGTATKLISISAYTATIAISESNAESMRGTATAASARRILGHASPAITLHVYEAWARTG